MNILLNYLAFVAAPQRNPVTSTVTVTYSDGEVVVFNGHKNTSADTYARLMREKIGQAPAYRFGKLVSVVSVTTKAA